MPPTKWIKSAPAPNLTQRLAPSTKSGRQQPSRSIKFHAADLPKPAPTNKPTTSQPPKPASTDALENQLAELRQQNDALKSELTNERKLGGPLHPEHTDTRDTGLKLRDLTAADVLEIEFGIELPKDLQRELSPLANDEVDRLGRYLSGSEHRKIFWCEFIERAVPWSLVHFHTDGTDDVFHCRASVYLNGQEVKLSGEGNGSLGAFVHALHQAGTPPFEITNSKQHTLSACTEASAISYIQIMLADGHTKWGAGVGANFEIASIRAVLSALNRATR
jgi:2-isopropylmalate synthase